MAAPSLAGEPSWCIPSSSTKPPPRLVSSTHIQHNKAVFPKSRQKSAEKILSSFASELELETCEVVAEVVGQIPRSSLLVVSDLSSYLLLWHELGNN